MLGKRRVYLLKTEKYGNHCDRSVPYCGTGRLQLKEHVSNTVLCVVHLLNEHSIAKMHPRPE